MKLYINIFFIFLTNSFIIISQSNFWTSTNGPVANSFTKFFSSEGKIFACTKGIFRSEDSGKNWAEIKGEIEKFNISKIDCDINGNLYADAFVGVYKSTANGSSWQLLPNLKDICD